LITCGDVTVIGSTPVPAQDSLTSEVPVNEIVRAMIWVHLPGPIVDELPE
jgi:hypothetical protein